MYGKIKPGFDPIAAFPRPKNDNETIQLCEKLRMFFLCENDDMSVRIDKIRGNMCGDEDSRKSLRNSILCALSKPMIVEAKDAWNKTENLKLNTHFRQLDYKHASCCGKLWVVEKISQFGRKQCNPSGGDFFESLLQYLVG